MMSTAHSQRSVDNRLMESGNSIESIDLVSSPSSNLSNSSRRSRRRQNFDYRKNNVSRKATSKKPHDAPMQRRDIYFALDCEMVGVGPEGLDSALARISVVNWDNEVVLDSFVQVPVPVTDYRTFVSGVRAQDLQKENGAITVEVCQRSIQAILKGKVLIGHGLENDLKMIGFVHPWCDIRDTATYAPFMRVAYPSPFATEVQERRDDGSNEDVVLMPRKLRDLAWEKLGKQIQVIGKEHCPIEDAIASLDLYKSVRTQWEMCMMKHVAAAREAEQSRMRIPVAQMFASSLVRRGRKVAVEIATIPQQTYLKQMHPSLSQASLTYPHILPLLQPNPMRYQGPLTHAPTIMHTTAEKMHYYSHQAQIAATHYSEQSLNAQLYTACQYQERLHVQRSGNTFLETQH